MHIVFTFTVSWPPCSVYSILSPWPHRCWYFTSILVMLCRYSCRYNFYILSGNTSGKQQILRWEKSHVKYYIYIYIYIFFSQFCCLSFFFASFSNFPFLMDLTYIRKEGLGSLERKYLWEDISHLSKSENIQEWLIKWVPVSIYTATEELRPKTEN